MRATTYSLMTVAAMIWAIPIWVFALAMITIYQRGFGTVETIFRFIAPPFAHVLVVPVVGLVGSLLVPPIMRRWNLSRPSLVFAALSAVLAFSLVILPSIVRGLSQLTP